jgi:type IV pilus assembly protein PilA
MPLCRHCRFDNPELAVYCASCGTPLASDRRGGPRQGLAIAALVLAVASLPLTFCLVGVLTAPVAIILGIVALTKANRYPAEYGGQGLAVGALVAGGVCLLFCIPIVAAIMIPSLLRARVSANEARAIGDVRTMISAEAGYAAANGGLYDKPECLAGPRECIPNYPATGATFLDRDLLANDIRSGYTRRFYPGPPASQADMRGGAVSPSSLKTFAYVALPSDSGRSGVRTFCGDDTGRVCATYDSRPLQVEGGRCPTSCTDLP